MINKFIQNFTSNKKIAAQCEQALLSASISSRFHKTQQQISSRFLNAYVRYMFDSVNLVQEIRKLQAEGKDQIVTVLKSIIRAESVELDSIDSPASKLMTAMIDNRADEVRDELMHEAKRKSHQFSQLSQSVLSDQRNNLLLSKTILMAKHNSQDSVIEELSMLQLGISPADAFAAKLLDDSDNLERNDNIDVICYASLAEGIRAVANSQMNHFFQMRRFEKERGISSFNGISSDEIIEQLELDVSLVLKYDSLIEMEQKHNMHLHRSDLYLSENQMPNLH